MAALAASFIAETPLAFKNTPYVVPEVKTAPAWGQAEAVIALDASGRLAPGCVGPSDPGHIRSQADSLISNREYPELGNRTQGTCTGPNLQVSNFEQTIAVHVCCMVSTGELRGSGPKPTPPGIYFKLGGVVLSS